MVAQVRAPRIRAWNPGIAGIREVFHARFTDHAYPKHTHEVWTLFIVDDGAIRYDLERRAGGAEMSMVSILPPHVVHDGRAADARGFAKRVLYLETSVIDEALTGAAVDDPILHAAGLRSQVAALHDVLICADDALEAETRLAFIAKRIRSALGAVDDRGIERPTDELAEQLRAHLDSRLFERITIADAATDLGASPTQLARSFAATFRIAPHAYVLGRRLEAARARILDGEPLAQIAAEVGFYDQAHLSRHFRRFIATPPGRFASGRARTFALRSSVPESKGRKHDLTQDQWKPQTPTLWPAAGQSVMRFAAQRPPIRRLPRLGSVETPCGYQNGRLLSGAPMP